MKIQISDKLTGSGSEPGSAADNGAAALGENGRVCLNIDLDAIRFNMESMHRNIKQGTKMLAVVKADAYGHGAVAIANKIKDYDFLWGFAVATVEEAMELREAGLVKPILILGFTFPEDYDTVVRNSFRPAVFKLSMAKELNEAAKRAGIKAPIHLVVDTGMSRIGLPASEEGADEAARIAALDSLEIEGLFSHFARADEEDKTSAYEQFDRYMKFAGLLEDRGISIPMKHIGNSAAIAELPDVHLDAVRAGITIYGIYPSDEVDRSKLALKPVMSLISHVAYIKEVPAGAPVSYGGTFTTKADRTRIATIPVGYGDGYPRSLSNKGYVIICGRKAKILGRVCMDQMMVDVTDIPQAKEGSLCTLIGTDGEETITMEQLGDLSGRFNYELACNINPRVPRVVCGGTLG